MDEIDMDKITRPTCPACGSNEIAEIASMRFRSPVVAISSGLAETEPDQSGGNCEFDCFECRICFYESNEISDFVAPDQQFEPEYEPWRHGGWYVLGVRHRNGGIGCVSRSYPDRRWRIVCDSRGGEHAYSSRDEAARAEYALTVAGVIE